MNPLTSLTKAEAQAAIARMNAKERGFLQALWEHGEVGEAARYVELFHHFPEGARDTTEEGETVRDIPHARSDDSDTSKRSAVLTEDEEGPTSLLRPQTLKHLALSAIVETPRTAGEVERYTGKRGIWKRVSDLKNASLVEPIGERHDPLTNRDALVWSPTALGESVLSRLEAGHEVRLS